MNPVREKKHRWTWPQVRFASQCWIDGMTQEQVANAIMDRFGFAVSRNSISYLTRVYRDLFPRRIVK